MLEQTRPRGSADRHPGSRTARAAVVEGMRPCVQGFSAPRPAWTSGPGPQSALQGPCHPLLWSLGCAAVSPLPRCKPKVVLPPVLTEEAPNGGPSLRNHPATSKREREGRESSSIGGGVAIWRPRATGGKSTFPCTLQLALDGAQPPRPACPGHAHWEAVPARPGQGCPPTPASPSLQPGPQGLVRVVYTGWSQ